jgi:signal peptidase II
VVLAVIVIAVLLVWLWRLSAAEAATSLALSLILGGAVGNLIDRLVYGYVIDFIDVYYGSWHWPAFNVADAAISVGAFLLLLDAFRGNKQHSPAG